MTPAEQTPVAVWRVTRTGQPIPGNLVGWGTADTLEAAWVQAVDAALDQQHLSYSHLSFAETDVIDATPVNPTVVEIRDCTVETMWDTSGAFAEAAS